MCAYGLAIAAALRIGALAWAWPVQHHAALLLKSCAAVRGLKLSGCAQDLPCGVHDDAQEKSHLLSSVS
jgi:hypothetical protein